MSDFLGKLDRDLPIAFFGANGSTYLNHCASSNTCKLTASCDLVLKCSKRDIDPDTGSSSKNNPGTLCK